MSVSPFKFLDSFTNTPEDKQAYFGRDQEVTQLYDLLSRSNLVVLYGRSGTGKTSLVQCGIAKRSAPHTWYPLFVRREKNLTASLKNRVIQQLTSPTPTPQSIQEALWALFTEKLKPIHLIFDQFEELFVDNENQEEEAGQFFSMLNELIQYDAPCKFIISIREEYIAPLLMYEHHLPTLFDARMRLPPMNNDNLREVILASTKHFGIQLVKGTAVANQIIHAISTDNEHARLPYLQIFLDKLWQMAVAENPNQISFDQHLVGKAQNIANVLKEFLDKQLKNFTDEVTDDLNVALTFLKAMVSKQGTKLPMVYKDLVRKLESPVFPISLIQRCLDFFVKKRLVRPLANEQYELIHDRLAERIHQKEVGYFSIPALDSVPPLPDDILHQDYPFTEQLHGLFLGREEEIQALYNKIVYQREQRSTVLYGGPKVGKTALLRAGLIPLLQLDATVHYFSMREEGWRRAMKLETIFSTQGEGIPNTIVILDDLEEMLKNQPEEVVTQFLEKIAWQQTQHPNLQVVFSLREAELPKLVTYNTLFSDIRDNWLLMYPMEDEKVRQVILHIHKSLNFPIEDPAPVFDQLTGRPNAKKLDQLLVLCQQHIESQKQAQLLASLDEEAKTKKFLGWKSLIEHDSREGYPEDELLHSMGNALAPYHPGLNLNLQSADPIAYRAAVIKALPIVGSLQDNVRRFLVLKQSQSYEKLIRLATTLFRSSLRLLNILLVSQLEEILKERDIVTNELQIKLRPFFSRSRSIEEQFTTLQYLLNLYHNNNYAYFFEGMGKLRVAIQDQPDWAEACSFFEEIEPKRIPLDQMERYGFVAEHLLSSTLQQLAFLATSQLISVIEIKKSGGSYFEHSIVKFGRTFLENEEITMDFAIIYPQNVLLVDNLLIDDSKQESTQMKFLDCSPWILDTASSAKHLHRHRPLYFSYYSPAGILYADHHLGLHSLNVLLSTQNPISRDHDIQHKVEDLMNLLRIPPSSFKK